MLAKVFNNLEKFQPYVTAIAAAAGPLIGWHFFYGNPVMIFASFFFFFIVDVAYALLMLAVAGTQWALILWQDRRRSLPIA